MEGKEALTRSLDGLLEHYLDLLDQYQNIRQSFAQNLSSVPLELRLMATIIAYVRFQGFLLLAHANFSNSNHTRYGQEFYDGRMQASTQV